MNLQQRKIEFVQEFLKLDDEETIGRLEKVLDNEKFKHPEVKPMSIDEFNSMIDKAEDDAINKRIKSVKELKADIDSWT